MLVNCSDWKKPKAKACATMTQRTGVPQADGGEEHDDEADADGVREQHGAVAEALEDARHEDLEGHGRDGLRHDEQAGLDGRVAEADLVQQRQEERHAAHPETGDEAAADGRAQGADAKEAQALERVSRTHRVTPVSA